MGLFSRFCVEALRFAAEEALRPFTTARKTWMAGSSPAMTAEMDKQKRPGLSTQPLQNSR
jgi:hypothetical protein